MCKEVYGTVLLKKEHNNAMCGIRCRDHGMGMIDRRVRLLLTFPMLTGRLLNSNSNAFHD